MYVVGADIIGLYPDGNPSSDGTRWGNFSNICATKAHEDRGWRWKTFAEPMKSRQQRRCHGGGARIASAAYVGDTAELNRAWFVSAGTQAIGLPERRILFFRLTVIHGSTA